MLIPDWYRTRCKNLLEDCDDYLASLENPLPHSIRVTNRIDFNELGDRLKRKGVVLEEVPSLENCFVVKQSPFSLGSTPEYLMGYYYMQGVGPQVPINLMPEGKIGMDLCAAPGGKSVQLSEKVDVLVAADIDRNRIKSLRSNLARCGVENAILFRMDGNDISNLGIKADRILVDAPCSGEGVIRAYPDRLKTLKEEDFAKYGERQKELLKSAAAVLEENGTLIYSVCSMSPEECEFVAQYGITELGLKLGATGFKEGSKGFTEIDGKELSSELEKTVRLWPHKNDTEGFYIAKFHKI